MASYPRSHSLPIPEFTFAVVGASGAGKSTFVRYSLDLKKHITSPVASKKMSLEGEVFLITLIEIQLNDLEVSEDYKINWPNSVGDVDVTRVNGVLALYDITEQNSITHIPNFLSELPRCLSCFRSPRSQEISRIPPSVIARVHFVHVSAVTKHTNSKLTGDISDRCLFKDEPALRACRLQV